MKNQTEKQQLEQLGYINVSYQNQDAHAIYYDAEYNSDKVEVKIVHKGQHENTSRELWERPAESEDWYYIEEIEE